MSLVKDSDLPERMKKRQNLAHKIAQQACEETWNYAIDACHRIDKQITGNDALSYFGTILQDFCGRWIVLMDRIRLEDDAGILREDLIKNLLNGILASIGCSADIEEEQKPLPGGINRSNERIRYSKHYRYELSSYPFTGLRKLNCYGLSTCER